MLKPQGSSPTGPQAFQGAPGIGQQRMGQQAARVVEVAGPAPVKRTHQTDARLTLRLPNTLTLNQEAVRAAGLRAGHPVEIICPRRGGPGQWLLDTRPTATARLREDRGRYRFRTAAPPDTRYLPARAHPTRLAFDLGPELMERVCVNDPAGRPVCGTRGTGVFQLLPRRA